MDNAEQLKTQNPKLKTLQYLTLVSRLVLGTIFALAGLAKLGLPFAMAESIRAYEMGLPPFLVELMANVLPPVELGVGIWLLLGLFTRFSAGITAALLVVFTIAITQAWVRGLDINCGCFGGPLAPDTTTPAARAIIGAMGPVGTFLTNEKADLLTIGRELVLLLMSIHLILVPSIFSIDQLRARARRQPEYDEEAYYDEEGQHEKADDSRELEDEHRPGQRVRADGLDARRP